ncbi:nuclear distribution protein [Grosmannia clavigera kw1407]|uniref:Nuclear distribution protein n=1 Tax=Grosmannia clavigera (strain kw1407 / UAMH 11150) TaxID=655863 RepID=F0XNS7_GROCL|nr:nuclear distribution protein [Grosmannia clavigera kw1407]EFX00082.1 nuclear distribution protein [Grosmannia clavigera kw1407]
MTEPPSSPPGGDASAEETLSWYKVQYEQLEHELIEFRESSRELEAELEKDLDAADKRERTLREKAEALGYEVDEWKRKYKESKTEANAAQNQLEKEITTLRDANRTLQLRLRDIEVANDDFERQARNTTSSLEDLESKYNVAIERGVLLEEEIKMGELEREMLRVDAQRLREELSELKIEADILQDKLKKQHGTRQHHLSTLSSEDLSVSASPTFDQSPNSTASSPLITTPLDSKGLEAIADGGTTLAELQEPPSPPMSDASAPRRKRTQTLGTARTPVLVTRRSRLPSADLHLTTPRPKTAMAYSSPSSSSASRQFGSRFTPGSSSSFAAAMGKTTPSTITTNTTTRTPGPRSSSSAAVPYKPTRAAKPPPSTTTTRATAHRLPSSNSLSHIRSLTAQMQRLEARVHSVRSKLPAPVTTPPRASPRTSALDSGLPTALAPSSAAVRSRKRTVGSASSSVTGSAVGDDHLYYSTPTGSVSGSVTGTTRTTASNSVSGSRMSTTGVGRLSFGPLPGRDTDSRPSSRTSFSSYARPASRNDGREMPPPRPMSRTSLSSARTPMRPRTSLGGSISMHGHSMSIGLPEDEVDTNEYRTPVRRGTYSRYDLDHGLDAHLSTPTSGIPLPGSRRQSGGPNSGLPMPSGRRTSMSTK